MRQETKSKKIASLKMQLIAYKGGECENCSIRASHQNVAIFDFHHKKPAEKNFDIMTALRGSGINNDLMSRLQDEVDKCKLLCANCHRLVHAHLISKGGHK